MRLVQLRDGTSRHVALVSDDGNHATVLAGVATVYDLATRALARQTPLQSLVKALAAGPVIDFAAALAAGNVLAPLDHPEPARFLISGTGLSHTGSAAARDKMHALGKPAGTPESD